MRAAVQAPVGHLQVLRSAPRLNDRVRYQNQLYPGEQPAIVPPETWRQVQELLQSNRGRIENQSGALLQGLLYCRSCGYTMTPTWSRPNGKRYRYYLCCGAHRRGRHTCPAPSIPARAIEDAVLEQLQQQVPDVDVRCQTLATQLRLVRLWIGRVDYDGPQNKAAITFARDTSSALISQPSSCTPESNS
jgi:site-specific DNA recombinase